MRMALYKANTGSRQEEPPLVFVIQEFGSQFECRAVEILVDSALTRHCNNLGIIAALNSRTNYALTTL